MLSPCLFDDHGSLYAIFIFVISLFQLSKNKKVVYTLQIASIICLLTPFQAFALTEKKIDSWSSDEIDYNEQCPQLFLENILHGKRAKQDNTELDLKSEIKSFITDHPNCYYLINQFEEIDNQLKQITDTEQEQEQEQNYQSWATTLGNLSSCYFGNKQASCAMSGPITSYFPVFKSCSSLFFMYLLFQADPYHPNPAIVLASIASTSLFMYSNDQAYNSIAVVSVYGSHAYLFLTKNYRYAFRTLRISNAMMASDTLSRSFDAITFLAKKKIHIDFSSKQIMNIIFITVLTSSRIASLLYNRGHTTDMDTFIGIRPGQLILSFLLSMGFDFYQSSTDAYNGNFDPLASLIRERKYTVVSYAAMITMSLLSPKHNLPFFIGACFFVSSMSVQRIFNYIPDIVDNPDSMPVLINLSILLGSYLAR